MLDLLKVIGCKPRNLDIKTLPPGWKPLKQHEKFSPLQAADWLAIDPAKYWEVNNALRFVDTISVRFLHTIRDPESVGLLEYTKPMKNGYSHRTYENLFKAPNGTSIHAMYVHGSKTQPRAGITMKFSVPKLVQGNNFQLIPVGTDIIALVNRALQPIFEQLGMPAMDFGEAEIRRLHVSYIFQVGKHVYLYLSYIGARAYPLRERLPYNNRRNRAAGEDKQNNGFCFYSKAVQSVFYAKGEECGNPLADGLLRQEIQYETPKAVLALFRGQDARFKSQRPRVIDLPTNLCQKVLYKDLSILRLNHEIIRVKSMWDSLREKGLSPSKTNHLMGFIHLEREYPGLKPKALHALSGLSEQTIRAYRRQMKEARIGVAVDEDVVLPPLTLDDLDDFSPQTDGIAGCGETISENDKNRTSVPHDICLVPEPAAHIDSMVAKGA